MRKLKLSLLTFGLVTLPATLLADGSADLYTPRGIRVGSFKISPSFESANEWNDNIYSKQSDAKSDFIFHLKPMLKVGSEWRRHSLNLMVGTDAMFYTTYNGEDKQNTFFNLDGRLDIFKNSFATAKFYYKDMREDRGSPDYRLGNPAEPLENETIGGTIGYEHKFNRVKVNVSHDIHHLNYIDGVDVVVGAPLLNPNHERSRMVNTSEIRLGYELLSGYEAYIKANYNFVDYDGLFNSQGGLDRSSTGYYVVSGIKIDFTGKLIGDAYIGYRGQNYKSNQLTGISDMTGGLGIQWSPTRLTTLRANIDRQVNETSLVNVSGFFSTALTASIDHELLRSVKLNLHLGYTDNDYVGSLATNRQEDNYSLGFYVTYLINRNLFLKAGYDYRARAVNNYTGAGLGSDYDINNVFFSLTGQL